MIECLASSGWGPGGGWWRALFAGGKSASRRRDGREPVFPLDARHDPTAVAPCLQVALFTA